jgi:hypothetical protein
MPAMLPIKLAIFFANSDHYRCEGIPPDPDKSSLPQKNTLLYVKETIHFFIYCYDKANYDGGLRSQISNQ